MSKIGSEQLTARFRDRYKTEEQAAIESQALELMAGQTVETDNQVLEREIAESGLALRACMLEQYRRHTRGKIGRASGRIIRRAIPGFRREVSVDQSTGIYSWQTPLLLQYSREAVDEHSITHGYVFGLTKRQGYDEVHLYGVKPTFTHSPLSIYEAAEDEDGNRELQIRYVVNPELTPHVDHERPPYDYVSYSRQAIVARRIEAELGPRPVENKKDRWYHILSSQIKIDEYEAQHAFNMTARKDQYTDYSHVRSYSSGDYGYASGSYDNYELMIGSQAREIAQGLMQKGLAELRT